MKAEARLGHAAALAQQWGRDDDALAEVQAVLAAEPRCTAAWVDLGNLHERAGRREAARSAYAQALAVEPAHALALARLAGVSAGDDEALLGRLRAALAAPGRSAEDVADLAFALGHALDRAGRYEEAFQRITQAHAADALARPAVYDRSAHAQWAARLLQAAPAALPTAGVPAPVFVCGLFRSGSTLVERMLARHPRVTAGGELDLLPVLARRHRGDAAAVRQGYLQGIAARFPGADVLVDKRPDNFLFIGLIQSMFPGAKIVHTRRDARDNALSLYFLHLGPAMAWSRAGPDIVHWMGLHDRLMAQWHARFPGLIHEVDYDRLVAEPRPEVDALLRFLGLGECDACLAPHLAAGPVATPSAWQVREPLYRHASGRWRHYAAQVAPWFDAG